MLSKSTVIESGGAAAGVPLLAQARERLAEQRRLAGELARGRVARRGRQREVAPARTARRAGSVRPRRRRSGARGRRRRRAERGGGGGGARSEIANASRAAGSGTGSAIGRPSSAAIGIGRRRQLSGPLAPMSRAVRRMRLRRTWGGRGGAPLGPPPARRHRADHDPARQQDGDRDAPPQARERPPRARGAAGRATRHARGRSCPARAQAPRRESAPRGDPRRRSPPSAREIQRSGAAGVRAVCLWLRAHFLSFASQAKKRFSTFSRAR